MISFIDLADEVLAGDAICLEEQLTIRQTNEKQRDDAEGRGRKEL